jgi:methyl-accepting chemotaxis protein
MRSSTSKPIVSQVAESTRGITADSGKIKVLVDEISVGSPQQSRGIEEISKAIQEMESVTQGTAAGAEQSAAAAQQLTAQAEAMNEAVKRLRALVYSARGEKSGGHSLLRAHAA